MKSYTVNMEKYNLKCMEGESNDAQLRKKV